MSNKFAELLEAKQDKEGRYISLAEVASETNITRPTLYKWQKNKVKSYNPEVIDKLCEYFGVEMTDLIEHVPDK